MCKKYVYIERSNLEYDFMFKYYGWELTDDWEVADLVQFTGGEDVCPDLYNCRSHPSTYYNKARDGREVALFGYCFGAGKPMAGICRGAQFLHVMSSGSLVQDCDSHASRYGHKATILSSGRDVLVSSTHHQMMFDEGVGEVLLLADEATYKDGVGTGLSKGGLTRDIEAMYYDFTNSLSFQPHPEFVIGDEKWRGCADLYFELINEHLKGI